MKQRTYYLHTIDKQPAYFSKTDGQIVFAEDNTWRDHHAPQYLRKTVRQIRRDQQTAVRNRKKWFGANAIEVGKYGYVRVVLPS